MYTPPKKFVLQIKDLYQNIDSIELSKLSKQLIFSSLQAMLQNIDSARLIALHKVFIFSHLSRSPQNIDSITQPYNVHDFN